MVRAGRFGIGAFAVFLLGPTFRLWTRHASVNKSTGYAIEASANSQLIEIRRVGRLPVGTTIEVEMSRDSVDLLGLDPSNQRHARHRRTDWFCWNWPRVVRRVISEGTTRPLRQTYSCPIRSLSPSWSVIKPKGFEAVYWTFSDAPVLVCNGLLIADVDLDHADFVWPPQTQLKQPKIAVMDGEANFPLTIQRYGLSDDELPFTDELTRDVTLSFIAHALVCSPGTRARACSLRNRHPLAPLRG